MSSEREIFVPQLRPYTPVYNDIIRDDRLRLQTRAVLILMISCPPDWDFSVRGMAKIAGCNKDTMAKMLNELEDAGYIRKEEQAREGGRFARKSFTVVLPSPYISEDETGPEPESADLTVSENFGTVEDESPCPKSPCPKTPAPVNSDEKINNIINNKPPKAPLKGAGERRYKKQPDWKPERFAGLWQFYPRGENKQAAIRAWDKLRPDDELIARIGRALQQQMKSEDWQRGIGIPHLSTYLNGARWEDTGQKKLAPPPSGWAPDPEVI